MALHVPDRENFLEYWLILSKGSDCDSVLRECLAAALTEAVGYVWQHDVFNLRNTVISPSKGLDAIWLPHLVGNIEYGDNVNDLWFTTYLLRRLTFLISDLVVKVRDTDGEFLLIEAADYLPKWINPSSAQNRVYMYQGKLHIVKPELLGTKTTPSIDDAVNYIREHATQTLASESIQMAINTRLNKYPEAAAKDMHNCNMFLPVKVAQLLAENAQLVSDAVRAFYLRDDIDLKKCQPMKYFVPENRVNMKVKLSRCLYAQLMQQNFHPPKRSNWTLPEANSPNFKAHSLGMKLAYGFEILCANASMDSHLDAGENNSCKDIFWKKYIQTLEKYNYFQGEIEGSMKYQELYKQAQQFYAKNKETSASNGSYSNKGNQILEALKHLTHTEEELRRRESTLTPDDDDSWLYLSHEELDDMIKDYCGSRDLKDLTDSFDPTQLVNSMSSFIQKQSNLLSGVEIPDRDVTFDSKGFLAAIEKMMNGEGESDLDSDDGSSLDDYESDDSHSEAANLMTSSSGKSRGLNSKEWKEAELNDARSQPCAKQVGTTPKHSTSKDEPHIEDFMQMMDRELSRTKVSKSFERIPKNTLDKNNKKATLADTEELSDDDDGQLHPIDVDFNLVNNLLESYSNQMGLPGPTSTLLGSMGVVLPTNPK